MMWGIALKGLFFVAMMYLIVLPLERFIMKRLPEGKLKKILGFSWEA